MYKNIVIMIDKGHGIDTLGKCSPLLKDSELNIDSIYTEDGRFKEWKYARVIAKDIVNEMKALGYDARLVVTEDKDISLGERVRRINKVCSEKGAGNVVMVSIHANAMGNATQWMSGHGWECYTTKGNTNSDKLAECLYDAAKNNFKDRKIRTDFSDGDSDKESNFYIIKHSNCPCVLTENFFYDNKDDLKYMTSDEGRKAVVKTHIEGIEDYIKKYKS